MIDPFDNAQFPDIGDAGKAPIAGNGADPHQAEAAKGNGHDPDPRAIRTHVEMLHMLAQSARDADGAPVDGIVTLTRIDNYNNVHTERFAIGDVEYMVEATIGWSTHPNLNLYSPFVIFRKSLPADAKGAESDVRAVLALVGDLDSDIGKTAVGLDKLPLAAPYVIESSAGNFQSFWPLATALTVEAAKPIAIALSNAIGGDTGTKDVSHVWRIPGTKNLPNAKKLARGRSPIPQLITVKAAWAGDLIDPEVLAETVKGFAPPPPKPRQPKTNGTGAPANAASDDTFNMGEAFDMLPSTVQDKITSHAGPHEDRSATAASVIWSLFRRGWSDDAVEEIISAHPNGIGERYTVKGKSLAKDIERLRVKWDAADDIIGAVDWQPPGEDETATVTEDAEDKAEPAEEPEMTPDDASGETEEPDESEDEPASVLDDLVARTATDPGAPFTLDARKALLELRRKNRPAFEVLRAQLKKAGCRVGELDKVLGPTPKVKLVMVPKKGWPTWRETAEDGSPLPSLENARRAIVALGVECAYDDVPQQAAGRVLGRSDTPHHRPVGDGLRPRHHGTADETVEHVQFRPDRTACARCRRLAGAGSSLRSGARHARRGGSQLGQGCAARSGGGGLLRLRGHTAERGLLPQASDRRRRTGAQSRLQARRNRGAGSRSEGWNKSTALRILAMDDRNFSDEKIIGKDSARSAGATGRGLDPREQLNWPA